MQIDFQDLSDASRIWIYGSPRNLTTEEKALIHSKTTQFLSGWQRHGVDVIAGSAIFYERFLVLATDEKTPVSGCAIDASVHFIKELSTDLGVDLLEKLRIDYLLENKIFSHSIPDFKKQITEGVVLKNTLVFNHFIQTKADLKKNWLIPAKNSWHKRYFIDV